MAGRHNAHYPQTSRLWFAGQLAPPVIAVLLLAGLDFQPPARSPDGVVWRTTQEIGSEGGGEELAWNGSELVVLATRLAIGRKLPAGIANFR